MHAVVLSPEYWMLRIETIPSWVSVLCKMYCNLDVIVFYTSMVGWWWPRRLLGIWSGLLPLQGDLTVRRVLPVKTERP